MKDNNTISIVLVSLQPAYYVIKDMLIQTETQCIYCDI